MKKFIKGLVVFILIFLIFNFTLEYGRSDNDKWYRVWGGNGDDYCYAIALDSSNNIYLGGVLEIFGAYNYHALCLVKYDNAGNYQWNKTIDGYSYQDCAITIDSSDNIFLASEIYNSNSSNFDIILLKFDSLGNYQWNKTWDGGKDADDYCHAIGLDSLENIYVAGESNSGPNNEDFCLVKYDNLGNFLWNKTWGGPYNDICWAIALDSSDNIFLAGDTLSFGAGNPDMCIVKYNNTGDFQWYKTWSNSGSLFCRAIVFDSLENIYLAGSNYNADSLDFCLVKFNNSGDFQWSRTWGGVLYDACYSMLIDPSENLYLAGTKGDKYSIVVYDTNGNLHWSKSLKIYEGGFGSEIARDIDGNIYIGACVNHGTPSNLDFLLIKNLQLLSNQQIGGYNIFLIAIMIGIFLFVIILKFKHFENNTLLDKKI
ncbi:MAG: SBBP repeat-containing protein [Candidatus Odinarchaeota archaeon]